MRMAPLLALLLIGCTADRTGTDPSGISAVVAPAMDSVVCIETYEIRAEPSPHVALCIGSGIKVSRDGIIVTCEHVIHGATGVAVVFSKDNRLPATVIASDATKDLAILHVDAKLDGIIRWGNSDKLRPGDSLFAVGFPFGLTKTCETGVVSAIDQVFDTPVVTTNAAINPGMSGGGAFDFRGRFIGMPVAMFSPDNGNDGIAYLIPSNLIHHYVLFH